MSKSVKRLGRGLNSLVSNLVAEGTAVSEAAPLEEAVPKAAIVGERPSSAASPSRARGVTLRTDELRCNPFQPRSNINKDSILSLAESIGRSGLLQPIVVRPAAGGYEIIAGERRWAAAKSLEMSHVPVLVREASDEQMLEWALIENIQREDLNAIDRAMAYRQFCDRFGLSAEDVARRLGEDRTTVVNYLRLLDLSTSLREMVAEGRLSMGHARCLLGAAEDARREELAAAVVANALSVRALEEIVRRERTRTGRPDATPMGKERVQPAHLLDIQRLFEDALKTKVTIRQGRGKGTGRITIDYYSLDDFDRIANKLGVELE